jgi:ABC-type dipeptide/oligopeptide/nickel transport system ATPase subunit
MSVGSDRTRLIVLRGNSGSGKSTVAAARPPGHGRLTFTGWLRHPGCDTTTW